MTETILVTGGAGFIGSHTCKHLAANGYRPVVFDNLSTGHEDSVLFGPFVRGDIRTPDDLDRVLSDFRPMAIIHFAACAYVGESMINPGMYYDNNVVGTLRLVDAMLRHGIENIIFSSSCATYGIPDKLPISETSPQNPINPYGMTKLIGESILKDHQGAHRLHFAAMRYFNASGADLEGRLRERHDPETHLIPRALMAATGRIPVMEIFGDDYDTADGTCVRDYIHVEDLAIGHILALKYLTDGGVSECFNLGTGRGRSIKEIIATIETLTNRKIPLAVKGRRPGDPAILYANADRARRVLGFDTKRSDLETIIRSALPQFEKATS